MRTLDFTLASAIRQMLNDADLGHAEFADAIDIGAGSVTNYTKGRTVPRWSTVRRWAEACKYDPDDPQLRFLWEKARGTAPKRGGAGDTWAPRGSNPRPSDVMFDLAA